MPWLLLEFLATLMVSLPLCYLAASFFESLFHDQILDVSAQRARFYFKIRKYFPGFWNIHVAHGVLHHHQTYKKSFAEQFSTPSDRQNLIEKLQKGNTRETVSDFVNSNFGNTFTKKGFIFYSIPVYIPIIFSLLFIPPHQAAAISIASFISGTPFFILSKWVHPYLHMTYEESLRCAPPWIRHIISSRYGVAIRISHWVHHREPRYNLNLQYGADLLRGRFRPPTPSQWTEMLLQGVILPEHQAMFENRLFLGHRF